MTMVSHDPPSAARSIPLDPAAAASTLARVEMEDAHPLPAGLCVVNEGINPTRLALLAGGMVPVGAFAATVLPAAVLLVGGLMLGVSLYRWLVPYRGEVQLTDEGIEHRVRYRVNSRPWITRIAWTDIAEYHAGERAGGPYLHVESSRGVRIDLGELPPTHTTRVLIARFVERAERHPRVELDTRGMREHESLTGRYMLSAVIVAFVGAFLSGGVDAHYDLTSGHYVYGIAAAAALFHGFRFWLTLGDSDVAWADRSASTFRARLRNRLRRLFRMRVV